jgi:hypothetical protein
MPFHLPWTNNFQYKLKIFTKPCNRFKPGQKTIDNTPGNVAPHSPKNLARTMASVLHPLS